MICPFCETENRDDREKCYHCDNDLSMLRLVVNKAKQHYNLALEHAERQRYDQAVVELRNTLELYNDFMPAHVVLGTIYAKLEQYDEAQRQWEKALALNPEHHKAYQYLAKTERVRESLPTVRRLWILVWSLGLVAVVAIVALFVNLSSSPDMRKLNAALDLYKNNNLGAAAEQFAALRQSDSSTVADAAEQWDRIISEQMKLELSQINEAVGRGDLAGARRMVTALREKNPGAGCVERLNGINDMLREATFRLWQEAKDKALKAHEVTEDVKALASEIEASYPNDPRVADIAKTLDEIAGSTKEAVYKKIEADYSASKNVEETRRRLQQLLAQHPGYQPAKDLLAKIAASGYDVVVRSCREALAKGDLAQARQFMAELERLAAADPSGAVAKEILALNQERDKSLKDVEAKRIKELSREDFAANPTALDLAPEIQSADRKYLETLVSETKRRLAQEAADWMSKLDWKYQSLTITPEQAEQTLTLTPLVLVNFPNGRWVYPKILFYQGAAQMKLGDPPAAEAAFEQLQRQYPRSEYVPLIQDVRDKAAKANKQRPAADKGAEAKPAGATDDSGGDAKSQPKSEPKVGAKKSRASSKSGDKASGAGRPAPAAGSKK